MTWQKYNKNLRKSLLLAEYFSFWINLTLFCFLFRFIAVPAKWIRTARQYKLNIYSNKPYNIIWEHG